MKDLRSSFHSRNDLIRLQATISSNDHLWFGMLDPGAQLIGSESYKRDRLPNVYYQQLLSSDPTSKHDRMNGPDAHCGQNSDHYLWN